MITETVPAVGEGLGLVDSGAGDSLEGGLGGAGLPRGIFDNPDFRQRAGGRCEHTSNNLAKHPITLEAVISRVHLRAPYGRGFTGSG
jgi:hypothetical protein